MSTVSWLAGPRQPVVWVLAAALGVQAAVIITHLVGSGGSHQARVQAVMANQSQPRLDLTALANGHLFGAAPPPAPVDDANASQTKMPLLLTGTIAGADPRNGAAIIGTAAGNAKVYPVGDRVPGNARVHAVYTDRVLLERNGVIEALMLPRKFTGGGPVRAMSPAAAAPDLVQGAAREPLLVTDVMRPQSVFAQGKMRGYRLHPGPNAQAFGTLGLRNGDLVVAINGTPLNDPARSNDIFSSLGNTAQARVTVMRNGQQQELTLNMSQIADAPPPE
jgi:general secretion pathway protein C